MSRRNSPPLKPTSSVSPQELRSQLAFEMLLNGYAILGSLIIFRALFKALGVSQERWVGGIVYGTTGVVANQLMRIPSASTTLVGDLTLVDLTLVAGVVAFPLMLLMFGNRHDR